MTQTPDSPIFERADERDDADLIVTQDTDTAVDDAGDDADDATDESSTETERDAPDDELSPRI